MGLCKSKLPHKGRALRPQEKDILKSALIVFVMGGPGCGKGTQCKNVATKYGFCHIGLGHLLTQEGQCSTQWGWEARDIMLQGLLVPMGIITDLIGNTMLSCQESWAFLTDGFPWKLKQAKELGRIVGRGPDLIMFDCSMDAMVCRVWHRGQKEHRVRDCESALRQGLETYDTLCEPVLTSYQQKNLLRNILAEAAPEDILPSAALSLKGCGDGRGWGLCLSPHPRGHTGLRRGAGPVR